MTPAARILAAAQWYADQHRPPAPASAVLAERFNLTPEQAADAVLMAGRFSVLRRAMA